MHEHNRQRLLDLATRVLGSRESALEWLGRPRVQLGGRSPRDLLHSSDGVQRVEELLAQIDDDRRLHGA